MVASFYQAKVALRGVKAPPSDKFVSPPPNKICQEFKQTSQLCAIEIIMEKDPANAVIPTSKSNSCWYLNSFLNYVINYINLCRPIEFAGIITRNVPPKQNQLNSRLFTSSLSSPHNDSVLFILPRK